MNNEIVYVVNLDYQLFSSNDIYIIEKGNFNFNYLPKDKIILMTKINQWNLIELNRLHNLFIKNNFSKINIEYDQWTNDLFSFFKMKNIQFGGRFIEEFESIFNQIKNNVIEAINILESKSGSFINDFMVYLISILPYEISNDLIKIYFNEKNSFKTTLIFLATAI